jgi:Flp pilus assembly protein TadD
MIAATSDIQRLFDQAIALLAGGDARAALRLAHQAWSLQPHNGDLCNLIGVCAMALGDGGSAEQCWLRALALSPYGFEAHFNLGMYYADSQRLDDAQRHFRTTLCVAPAHAGAYFRLGALLAGLGRNEDAERGYRHALVLTSTDSAVHSNLGLVLAKLRRCEEAELCYRQAIALNPAGAEAYTNLGLLLESRNRFDHAEQAQRRASVLKADSAEIHSNLGNLLARVERAQEAEQEYQWAIALEPQSAVNHSNLGVLLAYALRDAEAEQAFRTALTFAPGYQRARLNLAMLLLAQGRFEEGWPLHEARYHPDLPDPDMPMPTLPYAQWQGESLVGKSLAVWPEQGYGDMIQFCRYLPLLKRQGAARITLVCRAPLLGLMRTLAGVDAVLPLDEAKEMPAQDYWTLPMSLPLHCRTLPATVPADIPYLRVPADKRASWSARLPEGNFRVGLVWKGNPLHANDASRSLPSLSTLAPLWAISGVQFINVQYGAATTERAENQDMIDLSAEIGDFADTAAIVAQLDLLIAVDTAAAHVAGALGTPCWILLPAHRTDWRWMRERADSPWYPIHMRLFRQTRGQAWHAVVDEVAAALRERVALQPRAD